MIRATPLTFAKRIGQQPWPSAPHQCWRSQRQCRRSAHNLLLIGPPGAGTSRLARGPTTLRPATASAGALDTTALHRASTVSPAAWRGSPRAREAPDYCDLRRGADRKSVAGAPWSAWFHMHGRNAAATSWGPAVAADQRHHVHTRSRTRSASSRGGG